MVGRKSLPGRSTSDLDTPALLIDLDRMEANIHRYATTSHVIMWI